MTDRRTRWTSLIITAPGAAAVFGAATAWALHAAPVTQQPTVGGTSSPRPASPTANPSIAALQRSAAANRALLARLDRQVNALRAQLTPSAVRARAGSSPDPVGSSGGTAASAAGPATPPTQGPAAGAAPTSAAVAPAPPPAAAPPPVAPPAVPPPPTQTSTGASGGGG